MRSALECEGHEVSEFEPAEDVLPETFAGLYHLLILVSEWEGSEYYDLCRSLRLQSDVGIIVIAAGGSKGSRIDALNAGADDYLASPYVRRELLARVRALLRRVVRSDQTGHWVLLNDRVIDFASHQIKGPAGRVSHLTPKEHLVLQCLVAHANKPFGHRSLAQLVWQRDGEGEVEYMRTVIRQLRRKLEPNPEKPLYIVTERAVGYRFQFPPAEGVGTDSVASQLALAG